MKDPEVKKMGLPTKQGTDATVFNISFDDSLVWDTSLVIFEVHCRNLRSKRNLILSNYRME